VPVADARTPSDPSPFEHAPPEPSPAHTPLLLPAGVASDGTVAAPPATPATEAVPLPPEPFADELPPDFWGDELEPPATSQTASQPTPDERFDASAPSTPPAQAARPLSGDLESDPRFRLLQELFPGRISDWQGAEAPASTAEGDADDAPAVPETVDLEEGLDTDETD